MNITISSADPRHEVLRFHIIEAATKAFHAKGIKNVTMDDIAHSLTISKRTLYQTFADKEELLLACIRQHTEENEMRLANSMKDQANVLEFLLTMMAQKMKEMRHIKPAFFTEILKYPKVMNYFNKKQKMQENDAVTFLNKGIEQGFFRKDINFLIVYNQLTEGINTIIRNKVLSECPQEEVFRNTVITYIRGCATLKGIEIIDRFIEEMPISDMEV